MPTIPGGAFNDFIFGTSAADFIMAGDGHDTVFGGSGDDIIGGGSGDDLLIGGTSHDRIDGGVGDDLVIGGTGNDLLFGAVGDDTLLGGAGVDTVSYVHAAGGVTVNLATGVANGEGADQLSGIEAIVGTNFADTLIGDAAANRLVGGVGEDSISGGDGKDSLAGGLGDDTLSGGSGVDAVSYTSSESGVTVDLSAGTASGEGNDQLNDFEEVFGSRFDDLIKGDGRDNWFHGGLGDDTLLGGAGVDTVSYVHAAGGVTVNLATGVANGEGADQLSGIEAIVGTNFADTLIGDAAANRLVGGVGEDSISGGDGKDSLAGGLGDDTLSGGSGVDAVSYTSSESGVTVDLSAGTASGEGNDQLNDFEEVFGSRFDDLIKGDGRDNWFHGGLGDDTLLGGVGVDTVSYVHAAGGVTVNLATGVANGEGADQLNGIEVVVGSSFDDQLTGDAANNRLVGNRGDDYLQGGAGNDRLEGGAGADHFVCTTAGGDGSGFDVIRDFQIGVDRLRLVDFGFDDIDDVLAASHQVGSNTVIDLTPEASVTILGFSVFQLDGSIELFFG